MIRHHARAGLSALAILLTAGPVAGQAIPVEPAGEPVGQAVQPGQEADFDALRRTMMRLQEAQQDAPPDDDDATPAIADGPPPVPVDKPVVVAPRKDPPAAQDAAGVPVKAAVAGTGIPGRVRAPEGPEKTDVPTPPVDAEIVRRARDGAAAGDAVMLTAKDNLLHVRPGETQLIAVAEGHLNRIITPFAEVNVVTTSEAKFTVSGNVVYVSATSPATLFLTPKGDESVAIGLGVIPRRIPPREVTLRFEDGVRWAAGAGNAGNARPEKADRFERNAPFVETVRAIMRNIAAGTLPPGYGMRAVAPDDVPPLCLGPDSVGYGFDRGQVIAGSQLEVMVGTVTNGTSTALELSEAWCATSDVAAVAYWPHVHLEPGRTTEVYVLRRPGRRAAPDAVRPSLIVQ